MWWYSIIFEICTWVNICITTIAIVPMFTALTPHYNETCTRARSLVMRRVHPESRLDDLPFYCIGFKSAGPEFTLRAHIWASLRFQTLYHTVSGMMNVQQRQQRMSMCVAFFSISSFSGLMLHGSSSQLDLNTVCVINQSLGDWESRGCRAHKCTGTAWTCETNVKS